MAARNQIFIFVMELAILLLGGCHSQKEITRDDKPYRDDSNQRLISMLEQRNQRFNTLKIKKVEVDLLINGVREKIRGNIAIYRDSLIVISIIPALGYEILRVMCTKDSVIVISRPDKSYSATSFDHYREKYGLPVEFTDLQAILANEVFYYKENYGDRIFKRKLNTRAENNLYLIDSFRDELRITNQGIEIDSEGRRLENVFIIDYERKMRLNLDYEDFTYSDEIIFPKKIKVDLFENNNSIKMDIQYGKIVFDDSIHVEFSAPVNYTKVDI